MHHYERLKKFLLSKAVLPVSTSAAVALLVLASVVYVENDTAALVRDITNTVPQTQQVGGLFGACGSIFGTCQVDVYGAIGINPQSVVAGQTANLYWNSWGADYCYLSGGRFGITTQVGITGNVATDVNAPGSVATYGLRCYNTGGANAGTSPQYYASYTTCATGQVVGSSGCAAPPVTPPVNDITVECSAVNELGCPGGTKNNVGQVTKPTTGSKYLGVYSAHYGGDNATLAASAIVQIVGDGTMTHVNPDNYPYAPGSYSNAQVSRQDNTNPYHAYNFTITPSTPAGVYYFYAVTASNAYPWDKYPPSAGGWMNIASINVVENPTAAAPTNLASSCNASNTQVTLTWTTGAGTTLSDEVVVDDPGTTHVAQGASTNCTTPAPTATGAAGYTGSCGLSGTGIRADYVYSRSVSLTPKQAVVNIQSGKTYNWTVQGSNNSGFGTASAVNTFTCGSATTQPVTPPTVTLTSTVNGTAATGLKVGQSATLTGTFTAASGDTFTQTGIADNNNAYLVGGSNAITQRLYVFTPTAAGSYLFHARGATTKIPTPANYASRTLTVCSASQNWNGTACVAAGTTDLCPLLGGNQSSYPSGSSPAGSCTCPSGTTYNASSNACEAAVNQPVLGITGNNQTGSVGTTVGSPVTIRGTYAAAQGDTLIFTALNDYQNNALPGTSNTNASSPKTYTFTPTAPGSYVFYPAAMTAAYPVWNNYNQSLVVNVSCPAGQFEQPGGTCGTTPLDVCGNIGGNQATPPANGSTNNGNVCSCDQGYTLVGASCVQAQEEEQCGAHQTMGSGGCVCDIGYSMQEGVCVQRVCAGANEVGWPTCSCATGYERDTGTNMCIRQATLTIQVNNGATARVRKGNTVSLTWNATGVASGSCTVRASGNVLLSTGTSGSLTPTVGTQTTYTLRCLNDAGGAVSKSATVTLIPTVDEI